MKQGGAVSSVLSTQLEIFLEQNPNVAKITVEKSVMAQRAREAARKARDLTRKNLLLREHLFRENLQTVRTKILQNVKSIS